MSEESRDVNVPPFVPREPPAVWHTLSPEVQQALRIVERTFTAAGELKRARRDALALYRSSLAAAEERYRQQRLQPAETGAFLAHLEALGDRLRDGLAGEEEALYRWLAQERAISDYRRYRREIHQEERAERRAHLAAGPFRRVNVAALQWQLDLLAHDTAELKEQMDDAGGYLLSLEEDLQRAGRLLRRVLAVPERP